ncbi:MAG: DUF3109 family protein [Bacteroidota bacterium]
MEAEFLEIDAVMINTELMELKFSCDLEKCKGACCTMESEFGAPITQEEIEIIDRILPVVKEYLPGEHVNEINKNGFWINRFDQFMTRSLNNRACVFVVFENEIAKCGIEKAFCDGKVDFVKPISCHLFPIRINKFGGDVIRFEKYDECSPALLKGIKKGTTVIDFCRDALERLYGREWFSKLKDSVIR